MKTPTTAARTPAQYLAGLPDERRADLKALHSMIRRAAPALKPYMQSGMLGYGKYHYRYPSGREGDWCKLALASQKNYISLYVCAMDGGRYVADAFRSRLPKASIGKSCVRFKRLADVDAKVVQELLRRAVKATALGAN